MGEFPDNESIHNRTLPICYEEGLVGGAAEGASAFLNVATEFFVKEFLGVILEQTRSNGPSYIKTASYKRKLEREENALARRELQRNATGLLPVEQAVVNQRKPLDLDDIRVSLELGNSYLGHMPLTNQRIMNAYREGELYDENGNLLFEDPMLADTDGAVANGVDATIILDDDVVMLDDDDCGWEGGSASDRKLLESLLDECLAIG